MYLASYILCLQKAEDIFKKKIPYYKERDENARKIFLEEIRQVPEKDRIYLDESGINKYLTREHARALRGIPVYGAISGLKYARESFIAAQGNGKILSPFCFRGTCNTELFNMWIREFLIPALKPSQVVIMDNASFHKSPETKRLLQDAGCRILFLPPYSPDLNPIEIFWANLKKKVQGLLEKIKGIKLAQAIDFAFSELSV
jgi:transposase